ncbi:unnamed protein product, partial [Allacma fusca]
NFNLFKKISLKRRIQNYKRRFQKRSREPGGKLLYLPGRPSRPDNLPVPAQNSGNLFYSELSSVLRPTLSGIICTL